MKKFSFGVRIGTVFAAFGLGAAVQGCGGHSASQPQFVPASNLLRAPAVAGPRRPALLSASRVADAGTNLPSRPGGVVPNGPIPVCVPIGLAISKGNLIYAGNHWTGGTGCGAPGQITVYTAKSGKQIATRTITTDIVNPAGLAFDRAGNLYVADGTKNWVTVYDRTGAEIKKITTAGPPWSPSGVAVDSKGNVWVNDRDNSNIGIGQSEIHHKKGTVRTITNANLIYPVGVAYQSGTGDAWVANSETPQGNDLSVFTGKGNYIIDHAAPITPTYVAYASNGNLYATDGLHNEVQIFDSSGNPVGPPITDPHLVFPYGIAFDSNGNFWVANVGSGGPQNGSSIAKFNSAGVYQCQIKNSGCKP
jgi:hypothetical protein